MGISLEDADPISPSKERSTKKKITKPLT